MLQRRHLLHLGLGAIAFRSSSRRSNLSTVCRQVCLQDKLPAPKFWFGDQVCFEWECDDECDRENFGKTLRDYGVVIGLFFSGGSRQYMPGWNYFVSWRWVNGEAVENSDWDSAVHESDLIPQRCH